MAEAQIEGIKATLFNEVALYPNTYVLVDMGCPHPLDELVKDRGQEDFAYLRHADFADCPEKAPLLIRLEGRHDPVLDVSVEFSAHQTMSDDCRLRQVGGWLFSSLSTHELASLLSSKLKLLHGSGRARLRFYDPRVMAQLPFIFDRPQWMQLESGVEQWFFLNEGLQLQQTVHASPTPTRRSTFLVNTEQRSALHRMEVVSVAIHLLKTLGCPYEPDWIERIHSLIQRSIKQGFTEKTEQVAFAVFGIWLSPGFDRHPGIRPVLDEARTAELGFCQAMGRVDEEVLRQINYGVVSS
ncbi:DUF4123 domain-containing protein [Pseudomonas agarici]|uniref:DUF4123 domain-containing protein n=1 Tax=Pseudomonas agarici TaxID=46677 RepID=UPI00030BD808|nr:DUF4123 domain-containing protein [Pseudomonas agarici]NWC10772.1 DUF4123 domain-containing protein [Pseudomonas agarici]SEL93400.1 protein of unknown function [Pseudomonas agarici]